jgi:hypothetical protein
MDTISKTPARVAGDDDAVRARAGVSSLAPVPQRVDIDRLLCAYHAVLGLALDPPVSVKAVGGDRRVSQLTTHALMKVRPTFAHSTFLVRHIRGNLQVIGRAYSRRLATGQLDENGRQELVRIQRFEDSLPPAPPRFVALSLLILTVLLAQTVLSLMTSWVELNPFGAQLTRLASADASSAYDLAGALLHAGGGQLWVFVMSLSLAGYVVLRGPISGFRMARMLLNAPRALTRRNRSSPLAVRAQHWDVYNQEQALFASLRNGQPRAPAIDLLVKALFVAGFWFYGVYVLRTGGADVPSLIVLGLAALRFLWLLTAAMRRKQWVALLAGIAAASVMALAAREERSGEAHQPRAQPARSRVEDSSNVKELANAIDRVWTTRDLRGVDLRERNMTGLNLAQVDFKGAQLTGANLAFADLRASCLQHATLQRANLAGSDLRYADLRGANLGSANLHGAKLDGAGYDALTAWPAGYPSGSGAVGLQPRTRSRCTLPAG